VILVDVNLLLYASNPADQRYAAARTWLDGQLSSTARVGLPWQSTLGFARIATNPRAFPRAVTMEAAWQQIEFWLSRRNVWIPVPGPDHQAILGELLRSLGGGSKLISDAHLAALAIEHGLKLCSSDGDFARFKGLRWENPLAG
jgi:toxin-antitoxin system PIN domain toxin